MSKAKLYIYSLMQEIRYKITWPTYHTLQSSSFLVLVMSFVFALFVGLVDWSFKKFFVWIFNTF